MGLSVALISFVSGLFSGEDRPACSRASARTCRPSRLARSGFLVVLAAQAFGDVLRVLGDVTLLLGDLVESLLGFSVLAGDLLAS